MKKLLLVIDPQVDFITGSLPVPGAEDAMNALSEYIRQKAPDYEHVIVTADRHPMRHCSFRAEGGGWPAHCVADSAGAAIWPPVMKVLMNVPDKVTILHKGEDAAMEEYSIFSNSEAARRIIDIIRACGIEHIDICGLAGDVCVGATIRDWMALGQDVGLNVLKVFTPSIDGGVTLDALISEYGLPCDR